MFRISLVSARKLLLPRTLTFKCTPEACASSSRVIFDKRRSSHAEDCGHRTLLPVDHTLLTTRQLMISAGQPMISDKRVVLLVGQSFLLHGQFWQKQPVVRHASSTFQVPNVSELACNFLNMARCIDLNNLKDAPPPVFWVSVAMSGAQIGFPFLELIGGYSPVLTYLQLYLASLSLVWNGGMMWGLALSKHPKLKPDWDTMSLALMPIGFAATGLILPYPLGFLTVATGHLVSLYNDLKSCVYPPWSIAAKSLVTLSSVFGLLLALSGYVLFHNRENSKEEENKSKKENKKNGDETPPSENEGDGKEGGAANGKKESAP